MTQYAVPQPDVPLSRIITPYSRESVGPTTRNWIPTQASGAWPSANLGLFFPFVIPDRRSFASLRAGVGNGASVTGNVDIGVYDRNFAKLASTGAVAMSGGATVQDLADLILTLGPGLYYLGMSCSSASTNIYMTTGYPGGSLAAVGCFQMASAHPLPTTVTPAVYAQTVVPLFGISRKAVY